MDDAEERSLDLVQRLIISALVIVVLGSPAVALAAYGVTIAEEQRGTAVGLCVLAGVVGLLAAATVMIINKKRPYHPLALLGLLPAAIAAFLMFR